MEFIVAILAMIFFGSIISFIFRSIAQGGQAVVNTARGQGTLGENLNASFRGVPNTGFRVVDDILPLDNGETIDVFRFEMRGLIPGDSSGGTTINIAISLFDEEAKLPIMCLLDEFQEARTRFFLSTRELGYVPPDSGFTSWTTVGFAIKNTLIPPRSGDRSILALFRFMYAGAETEIYQGRLEENSSYMYGAFAYPTQPNASSVILNFNEVGYVDIDENSEIAQTLALKLAVSLAMVDGDLHEAEGFAIKNWIQKYVEDFQGARREEIKSTMNKVLEEAYKEATTTGIDREPLLLELNRIGQKIDHYETLELLMDIMAADEAAHSSELEFLNHVGSELGISTREIQNMKDLRLIDSDQMVISENNAEEVLGINPNTMSKTEICERLEQEFLVWNSRIQSLENLEERETAQNMLNMISQAQIKYCG